MKDRILNWPLISRIIFGIVGAVIVFFGHSSMIVAILGVLLAVLGISGPVKLHAYFGSLFQEWFGPLLPRKDDAR